jgi:hypothetical protein
MSFGKSDFSQQPGQIPNQQPGMGGQGSNPFMDFANQAPNIADQIVAQQPSLTMPTPPQSIPLGVQQGGTPGRPSPAAPMVPRGPGYANPGASGVARSMQGAQQQQQQMYAPQTINFGIGSRVSQPVAPNMVRGAGRGGVLR